MRALGKVDAKYKRDGSLHMTADTIPIDSVGLCTKVVFHLEVSLPKFLNRNQKMQSNRQTKATASSISALSHSARQACQLLSSAVL